MNRYGIKVIVITIAVIAVVSLGIAGVISATSGIFRGGAFIGQGEGITVDEEKSYPISDVETIKAFSTSSEIEFKNGSGGEVRFHLHGTVRTSSEGGATKLVERRSGTILYVGAEPPKGVFQQFSSDLVLDVYLPESFTGNLEINSVSGDLTLPFGRLNTLSMDTTSGEISFTGLSAQSMKLNTTSGDIKGSASVDGHIAAETTSGRIEIAGTAGSVKASSTSGDLEFDLTEISGDIEIDSTSGEVDLGLPKDLSFEMSLKATSGDLTSEFPVSIQGTRGDRRLEGTVGGGGSMVTVKTVSGDISIRQR